jgi:hypothetical protein
VLLLLGGSKCDSVPHDRSHSAMPWKSPKVDPIEHAIETALQPGRFIGYGASSAFVSELDGVEAEIKRLIRSAPERATALYEAFLAGCYEKAEEIDDSLGNFGMFVESLVCGWIKARQAAEADARATADRTTSGSLAVFIQ